MTREEYINRYKWYAMLTHLLYRVPASITLAQGAVESGNGNSTLAVESKNHFGIKGKGKVYNTREFANGQYFYADQEFRTYNSVYGSYVDHAKLLRKLDRYQNLFSLDTPQEWAHGLEKSGYSVDPIYAETLIDVIEKNDLARYDWFGKYPALTVLLILAVLSLIILTIIKIVQHVH